MRNWILSLALVLLMLVPTAAYGSGSIKGKATKCTGTAACSYTISSSSGIGWASTTFAFSGLISFQLPGESKATYNQPYSIQVVSVVGPTYTVKGTFAPIDANTHIRRLQRQ